MTSDEIREEIRRLTEQHAEARRKSLFIRMTTAEAHEHSLRSERLLELWRTLTAPEATGNP